MWVVLELAEDVERVSHGAVQGMALRVVQQGSELKLHSINATYYLRLVRGHLQCIQEIYGEPRKTIHESEESIADWEKIRDQILRLEGYEPRYIEIRKLNAGQPPPPQPLPHTKTEVST